jgi:hypothetical protein
MELIFVFLVLNMSTSCQLAFSVNNNELVPLVADSTCPYYLSASEIYPDQRGHPWWEWLNKTGTHLECGRSWSEPLSCQTKDYKIGCRSTPTHY